MSYDDSFSGSTISQNLDDLPLKSNFTSNADAEFEEFCKKYFSNSEVGFIKKPPKGLANMQPEINDSKSLNNAKNFAEDVLKKIENSPSTHIKPTIDANEFKKLPIGNSQKNGLKGNNDSNYDIYKIYGYKETGIPVEAYILN